MTICTAEFASLGSMEAKALQMPRLQIVTISHPLGGLNPEEVADKAGLAFEKILNTLQEN